MTGQTNSLFILALKNTRQLMVQEPCPRGLLGNMKRRNGKRRQKEQGIGKGGRKTNTGRCARERNVKCEPAVVVRRGEGTNMRRKDRPALLLLAATVLHVLQM